MLSETSEVTLTHSMGETSDHWPNQAIEQQNNTIVPDSPVVPGGLILLDYQTEFDEWVRSLDIDHIYDSTVSQCVVQMRTEEPFDNGRDAWTVTHDCDGIVWMTVNFPGYQSTDAHLTDLGHNDVCSSSSAGLTCTFSVF